MRTITIPIVILSIGLLFLCLGVLPVVADESSEFEAGLNFWAYPVQPATGYSSYDLIQDLNNGAPVSGLQRYNAQTGEFESCVIHDSSAAGVDFPITEVEGYVVSVGPTPFQYIFSGSSNCPDTPLNLGFNLAGFPCAPVGYSSYSLLNDVGFSNITCLKTLDAATGHVLEATWSGSTPVGDDFSISAGRACITEMSNNTIWVAPETNQPPQELTAYSGNSQIVLTWEEPYGPLDGYKIYRSGNSGGSYAVVSGDSLITALEWTDTGVTNNTPYFYIATAVYSGSSESVFSVEVTATATTGSSTTISSDIAADTTWTMNGSPYIVTNSIQVPLGVTLTIEPGVVVRFDSGQLEVRGKLEARGTEVHPVTFSSNSATPVLGDWTGIRFIGSGADGSKLEYCRIEHAVIGIYCADSSPEISHCEIVGEQVYSSIYFYGIYLLRSNAYIHHSNISHFINDYYHRGWGIYMSDSSPLIEFNEIQDNENAIGIHYKGLPQILNNTIENFRIYGIYCNGVYQSTNAPFPVINGNTIQTSYAFTDTYHLYVKYYATSSSTIDPSLVIDAKNNYWGTTEAEEIAASIHQWPNYSAASPFVDFRGFLTGAGGSAVSGTYVAAGRLPTDDITWTAANGPYIILGHTFVGSGQTLTIEPGTEVRFIGGQAGPQNRWVRSSLRIDGKLDAQGLAGNKILFTSDESTPVQGDWDAIYFNAGADNTSIISHSRIEYAYNGIWCSGASPTISNNEIIGVSGDYYHDKFYGLRLENGCMSQVTDNLISGFHNTYVTTSYGARAVYIFNASPTLNGNTISESNWGILIGVNSYTPLTVSPVITDNEIINNRYRSIEIFGDYNETRNPQPIINNNNITTSYIDSGYFALYTSNYGNPESAVVNNRNNWWGTADPEEIGVLIRDWNDYTGAPVVDYRGWLGTVDGTPVAGTQIHAGLLTGLDLSWTSANSPYLILGRIKVAAGDTLTIGAGTEVIFVNGSTGWNDRGLEVRGTLTAIGTFASPIVFRSNRPDATLGDWTGIRFIGSGADASKLEYCRIENAATGIYIEDASPEISYCTIVGEEKTASAFYYGIYLLRSDAHIHDSNISIFVNNDGYYTAWAIYINDSSPLIEYNTIRDNENAIGIYYGGTPEILNNTIQDFRIYGIYCNGEYKSTNAPFPVINGNIIQTIYHSINTYHLYVKRYAASSSTLDPSLVIDAKNNYWGTTKPEEITAAIYQWPSNNVASPFVDFRGFLGGPGGSAVPGTYIAAGRLPSDNTTWTAADGPYIILGHTFVGSGQTLIIEPGTEVRFIGGQAGPQNRWVRSSLRIDGKLDAQGISGNEILFTSHESTPVQGDWDAIYFNVGADNTSIISHSRIEYAYNGIWCSGSSPTISNNEIIGISGNYRYDVFYGLRLENGCTSQITNNLISGFHNTYVTASYGARAVYIFNASPTLNGNTISESNWGIRIGVNSYTPLTISPVITDNEIINNHYRSIEIFGDYNEARNPQPIINNNNITTSYIDSGYFALYTSNYGNPESAVVNNRNNWWGTADPEEIGVLIRDWNDYYSNAPVVDYRNWLQSESPGGTATTGTQIYAGLLTGDDLSWTAANSPYLILGRIKVAAGDTLTIGEGTEVIFVNGSTGWNDRGLEVRGTLTATGSFASPIVFRSNRPEATLGDWTGLRFIGSGADASKLEYCRIENAATGLYIEDASPEISYCTIVGEEKTGSAFYYGIYLLRSDAHIHDSNVNNFVNNDGYYTAWAIYMNDSSPLIEYNTIRDNENAIGIYYGGTPEILNNTIQDFRIYGIYCNGDYRSANAPFPVINSNTIQTIYDSSETWHLHVWRYAASTSTIDPSLVIDAKNNYWGTTEPEEITAAIYQWPSNNVASPFVDFRGFLDESGGSAVSGTYIAAGRLPSDNTTWTAADGPYIILGHTFVGSGQTLTIEPGTEVRFIGGQAGPQDRWVRSSLRIDGKLDAQGLAGNKILFTSHESTPVQGDWDAIYFNSGADSNSIISHSRIEYAFNGIWCSGSSPTISNNEIIGIPGNYYHDYFIGLRLDTGSAAAVSYNTISGFYNSYSATSYYGRAIYIYNASPTITGNVLDENSIAIWIETYNPPVSTVTLKITGNSIINSHYRSVYINGDWNDAENPNLEITGNNIFSEHIGEYSFYTLEFGSSSSDIIDATGNWWGTTVATEIDSIVRDRTDNGDAALVDYSGSLGAHLGYTIYSVTVDDDYFSPNGDGQQDSVIISGTGLSTTSWEVTISDATGTVVRIYTGNLPWTWDGKDNSNTICADGSYTILVEGTDGITVSTRTLTIRVDTVGVIATIDTPAHGSTQHGLFYVLCSVNDDNLLSYTLELRADADPTNWKLINEDNSDIYGQHVGAMAITSQVLYNWISNETETDSIPVSYGLTFNNGDYTLRLTAIDRAGNTTVTTSTITLDNIFITDVSRDNSLINPDQSQTANINFIISHDSNVSIKIYPEWQGEADGIVREITDNVSAGARTISWNGIDDSNETVADEAYIYVIEASDGIRTDKYLPINGHSDGSGVGTISSDYNVFTNDFWKIDYNVNGPSGRVSMEVTPSGETTFRVVDMEPHEAGEDITFLWDGRRPNGTLVEESVYIYFPPPTTLRSNYIMVHSTPDVPVLKGIAPNVEVKSDPYLINFCYGEFTHLLYNLDRAADVTVTILPPGITDPMSPEAIVVIDNEPQDSGDHTVSWNAIDQTDPKNITISVEGVYTFVIEATASGNTSSWRGVLNLYR